MGRDRNEDDGGQFLAKQAMRLYRAFWWLEKIVEEPGGDGVAIMEFSIKTPQKTGQDYLGCIKGTDTAGQKFVAWCSGATITEMFQNAAEKASQYGFNWRPDIPWEERQAKKNGRA